jgi:hypothetical protein
MSLWNDGWEPRVRALFEGIRTATREAVLAADESGDHDALWRPAAQGAGDVSFGLDLPSEAFMDRWLEDTARERPVSLMTEDAGWRHRGPDGSGGVAELGGFDHGGPRIAVDPVDGTRNLMTDLRSAWTVIGFCEPGAEQPRLADVATGLVGELSTAREERYRIFAAEHGGGARVETWTQAGEHLATRPLVADADDRCDHGYFPFFRYAPELRAPIAQVEAAFFARLAEHEGADTANCYDDQYCASAGQLMQLALGQYRFVCDLRPQAAAWTGGATTTSKPYDVTGALLVAREAGCVVHDLEGRDLDAPIDPTTAVGFRAYANRPTAERLAPHLDAAIRATWT